MVLDLGAGTGVIGAPLAEFCVVRGAGYLALDLSLGMLARFRRRLTGDAGLLLRADASRTWPLADASVGVVFAARAAHLLDADAFLCEVRRVLVPKGVLLLGAVQRDREAPRAILRRRLHELLSRHGVEPRSARRRHGEVSRRLGSETVEADEGAEGARQIVASWTVEESLETALEAWDRPGHLAGHDLPATMRREVLEDLRAWALDRWTGGRYDADHAPAEAHPQLATLRTTERFELTTVRFGESG